MKRRFTRTRASIPDASGRRHSITPSLHHSVLHAIERHGLLRSARALVVGVSGGADSTALACLLAPICRKMEIRLVLAHLHHGIRGRAAEGDLAFVRRLAAELGAEFRAARADVPARARRDRVSVEMAARASRHDFLAAAARECGADRVALAHTADDQAETVLLKLARGAGRGGLGGMAPDERVGGLRIVRPLLDVPRERIEAYLRQKGRTWREDATNRDPRHLRNRVRRRVLPTMARELNPRIREAIVRAAGILRAEDSLLDTLARRALRCCLRGGGGLDAETLRSRPAALRGRVVLGWLRAAGVPEAALTHATVERALGLAGGGEGTRVVPVGGGSRVECVYGVLRVAKRAGPASPPPVLVVVPPGTAADASTGLRLIVRRARGFLRRGEAGVGTWPAEAYVDWSRVAGRPLVWRPWRAGDRMRPLGAPGVAKIHDLLVNLKIPRPERGRVTVVECDGELVWLPGHRIAEGWQVRGARAPAARLRIERFDPAPAAELPAGGGAPRRLQLRSARLKPRSELPAEDGTPAQGAGA